jgi:hypothetical protein
MITNFFINEHIVDHQIIILTEESQSEEVVDSMSQKLIENNVTADSKVIYIKNVLEVILSQF